MNNVMRCGPTGVASLLALALLAGCQSAQPSAAVVDTEGVESAKSIDIEIAELGSLVAKTQEHERHPFRKRLRDERNRMMNLVEQKTETLLARLDTQATPQALTGTAAESDASLRASLLALKKAAGEKNAAAVGNHYEAVQAGFRRTAAGTE